MNGTETITARTVEAACPSIDADTALTYIDCRLTVDECRTKWIAELHARLQRSRAEIQHLKGDIESIETSRDARRWL